jgi:phosphate transport system substrate-binding protein
MSEMNLAGKVKSCRFVAFAISIVLVLGLSARASAEHAGSDGRPTVDLSIGSYTAKAGLAGGIAIAGSDTMQPILGKVASAFRQWQPDVKIAVQGGGSDAALRGFLQNQATIRRGDALFKGHHVSGHVALLASSRALTAEERKDFQSRYGYEPTEIQMALDAVAIYVNRQNPIQGLTMEQLDAIFGKDRKRGLPEMITQWGQVGLRDGWEQQPIRLYGRDKGSGTRSFLIHEALLNGELRGDVREEIGPASIILALSRDPLGIGYAGIGFQASTVRVVPLAEKAGMPFVAPSAESAAHGTYPLSRFLYLYAKQAPKSELDPEVLEFLKFVNSREGQEAVIKAGVYPLSPPQVAKNLQILLGASMTAASADPTPR